MLHPAAVVCTETLLVNNIEGIILGIGIGIGFIGNVIFRCTKKCRIRCGGASLHERCSGGDRESTKDHDDGEICVIVLWRCGIAKCGRH